METVDSMLLSRAFCEDLIVLRELKMTKKS